MELNKKVRELIQKFEDNGYECYVVGGAVRNHILKREIKDYDLVTNASLTDIKNILNAESIVEYQKGHTVAIIYNRSLIDISSTNGKTVEEDLKRRDFTVNTLLYNPRLGLLDTHGGIKDLLAKSLNTVDCPIKTLKDDPIRILRAIRFEGLFGLKTTTELYNTINENPHLLANVSIERITQELNQILLLNEPSVVIKRYVNVFTYLFDELEKTIGFKQQNKYHIYDVFEHTLKVLDSTSWILELRLAALFHDIKKPDCFSIDENGVGHFYGHYKESMYYAKEVLQKYKYPHKVITKVLKLIYYHDYRLELNDKILLKFLEKYGIEDLDLLFTLKRADVLGQNLEYISRIDELDSIEKRINELIIQKKYINRDTLEIKGADLIAIGFPPGSTIGKVLDKILYLVRNNTLKNDKEVLIEYAKTLINYD